MIEVKSPRPYKDVKHKLSVFLAGSIEMGTADDWQSRVIEELKDVDNLLLLNPRREDWDENWEQSIDNPEFNFQVNWELDALKYVDYIVMYYAPTTRSPITMMEFGLYAKNNPQKMIVCCPEGFWRKGNVDIVCQRYNVTQVSTLDDLVNKVKELVANKK